MVLLSVETGVSGATSDFSKSAREVKLSLERLEGWCGDDSRGQVVPGVDNSNSVAEMPDVEASTGFRQF